MGFLQSPPAAAKKREKEVFGDTPIPCKGFASALLLVGVTLL
jgi:hypothetical protein